MFSALASAIYGFYEKRLKNKLLVTLCYFLTIGAIWAAVTFCIGWMFLYRNIVLRRVDADVLKLIPLVGFILGEIFAFFPWILGLNKSGDDTRQDQA